MKRKFMKTRGSLYLFFAILLLLSSNLFGQHTTVPIASTTKYDIAQGIEPVDDSCDCDYNCTALVQMEAFCYGTNLRAVGFPLSGDATVISNVTFNKKDKVTIKFPAELTYALDKLQTCKIIETGSTWRRVQCEFEGTSYIYKIDKWKGTSWNHVYYGNIAGYAGDDYYRYSGKQLNAVLESPAVTDENMKKRYCFYSVAIGRTVSETEVNCLLKSKMKNYNDQVKVFQNDVEVPADKFVLSATTNGILLRMKQTVNGVYKLKKSCDDESKNLDGNEYPEFGLAAWDFKQEKVTGKIVMDNFLDGKSSEVDEKTITDVTNNSEAEKTTGKLRKTFYKVVKFPGAQGFCGGYYSPLMLFFDAKRPKFTGMSTFPLYDVGQWIHWPEAKHPGYFLAYDEFGNREIHEGKQLFGKDLDKGFNNGFEKLRTYDENKDGVIDAKDKAVWNKLLLWNDKNGNGVAEDDEVTYLKDGVVSSISLKYKLDSKNQSWNKGAVVGREKSNFTFVKGKKKDIKGDIIDIWFRPFYLTP